MPEIVSVVCNYKTVEEMDEDLDRGQFEELDCKEIDPTIRRVCERAGHLSNKKKVTQEELVRALSEGKNKIEDEVIFGVYKNFEGHQEYVGLNRKERVLVIVDREWIEKRKQRYETHPIPKNQHQRFNHVEMLIFEIVEKWSGTARDDPMGASYAQIVGHVADYSNIERVEATELVNIVLPTMGILERTAGDYYRIKPFLFESIQKRPSGQLPS